MATLELDTRTDGTPHYNLRTQLEGTDFLFTFRFGQRRSAWVFDLATLEGVPILSGQLMTVGRDFLQRCSMSERPLGKLWCFNMVLPSDADGGVFALPGLYDLGAGGRARFYYVESVP